MYFVKYGKYYLHDPRVDGCMLLNLELDCEENSCGFCDFTIYSDHPMYDKLREHDANNQIEVYDDDILLFAGFIYELGKEFYLDGHVKCKGELDYLRESIVRPYSTIDKGYGLKAPNTVNAYFEWLIRQHNNQAAPNKEFIVGVNQGASLNNAQVIFEENIEYPTVIDEIKAKLIDVYGGYLVTRHENGVKYIDYLAEWTGQNSQILDFGVNLTDYTQTDDSAEVSTFIVPLGAKMSETECEYDDGYFVTTDTVVNESKEYYTENNEGYSRCENLTSFFPGTTYYESTDNGYYITSDAAVDLDKQYYTLNTEIAGYSKCNGDLVTFKHNVLYYEYDENEDESDLPLTIDDGLVYETSIPGFTRSGDLIYSKDGVKKYGWIGMTYKNTEILTKQELIDAGAIELKKRISPKRTIEIKAVDMHLVNPSIKPIRIGEYVRVRSKPHDLDSYFLCVSIDLDLNNPENSLYTLGTTFDTLTGQQNKRINELNATIHKQYERAETVIINQAMDASSDASRLASSAYSQAVNAANSAIIAKNTADDATARVELIETQVTTVQNDTAAAAEAALQAQEEASEAITSAGEAAAIANQINNEISDVKGDATTLRDALEGQIETKVTTMTSDYVRTTDLTSTETTLRTEIEESAAGVTTTVEQIYAKKTELTDVEADLRTELRQTSDAIESVVSDVTVIQNDVTTAQTAADQATSLANAAQSSADTAGANAAAAQQAADDAQAAIDSLNTSTSTRISAVEQTSNALTTRVTSAETTVNNLEASIESQFTEVEETAEGISVRVGTVETDLSNLVIGGRNLYLETRNFYGARWLNMEYWTQINPSTTEYTEYGRLGSWMGINQSVSVIAGEQYTFSFYAKGDAEALVSVYTDQDSTATTPDQVYIGSVSTDVYTRYSATFTANITGTINPRVENTTESWLQICALKFEKGSRPTDWTPAPEDIENAIVDAKASATDYLNFSTDGLTVGDMTAGTLGKNVNISGSGIDLRNGSVVMASFTPTMIDFEQPVVFKADGIFLDNSDAYSYLGRNTILWTHATGKWMVDSITLNANITRQLSGAVFAWCYFENGAAQDTKWRYFFVPKHHVDPLTGHPGAGIYMTDPYLGMNKYIYVSNSSASGIASNSQSGITNGLSWDNSKYVLRYVIGM